MNLYGILLPIHTYIHTSSSSMNKCISSTHTLCTHNTCIHTLYTHTHTHTHTHIHTCNICVRVCIYTYYTHILYIHMIYIYTHIHIIYIYIIHTHTHTHTHTWGRFRGTWHGAVPLSRNSSPALMLIAKWLYIYRQKRPTI
jgi:hypothetical protein